MIYIALGANLSSPAGTPPQTLHAALALLSDNAVRLLAVSRFYTTPAWPDPSEPVFVNAAAQIETALPPNHLMTLLHGIEEKFGRIRGARNAPRSLDIDLLDYDQRVEVGPPELPHPRLADRAFVLLPLWDIAPNWQHAVSKTRIEDLIEILPPAARDAVRPFPGDPVHAQQSTRAVM